MLVKRKKREFQAVAILAHENERLVELVFGKNTTQYIKAKKEIAESYVDLHQNTLAYNAWLEAYELARKLHNNEQNVDWVDMLLCMGIIKTRLHQFFIAKIIFATCKRIEEKLSANSLQRFRKICEEEKTLIEKEKQSNEMKKPIYRNQSILSKIVPNTLSKLAIYMTAITATVAEVMIHIKSKN